MSATCPACGVAVVPGYAKCPKCHKPLLAGGRRLRTVAGGTVAEDRRFPFALVLVPIGAVVVIVLLLKLIAGDSQSTDEQPVAVAAGPAPQGSPQPAMVAATVVEPPRGPPPAQPQGPDPNAAAGELERALRGRRLWSTVEVSAARIDVRSGACDDPGMGPTIDTLTPVLHGAGLTRLRCLAQSGTVVFERDL